MQHINDTALRSFDLHTSASLALALAVVALSVSLGFCWGIYGPLTLL